MSGLSLSHEPVSGVAHGKLAMWAFLASEIMFFSGFFGAFIVLRNSNLDVFSASAAELNKWLALVNTIVLIGSSLTMALSILQLQKGNVKLFRLFMGLTILCGLIFLVVKTVEYSGKFHHVLDEHEIIHLRNGVPPNPDALLPGINPSTNVFFAFYFLMTGFHAIHVIAGLIPMVFMFIKSFTKGGYNHPVKVESLGLYWHFVDLVWIFLFPILYLIFPAH
ncbi:MAG: heme-copper oxidase subunit III [Candidatus Kapaibacterium sp.]|jgi:cytochrome c oxidase subunit 3